MTIADPVAAAGHPSKRAVGDRMVMLAVSLAAMLWFLWLAQHIIQAGYQRADITALEAGEAWKRGGWLSQIVLSVVGYVPGHELRQSVLSLVGAAAAGAILGVLYGRLRATGWYSIGALLVIAALGTHALALYAVTGGSRAIPLLVAFAALIPAIRALESVGDVQSAISLGLMLPLLLLASPTTTPLILPLAVASALADRDGRRDIRAFVAMVLVAVLPSIIVAVGVIGFTAQAGFDVTKLVLPYVADFRAIALGDWRSMFGALAYFAPVLAVPLLYCVVPNAGEPPRRWSAVAVVALPLYLAIGGVIFPWNMPFWGPPIALLATFGSWLAIAHLKLWMRVLALATLFIAVGLSWLANPFWQDAEWLKAIHSVLPFIQLR